MWGKVAVGKYSAPSSAEIKERPYYSQHGNLQLKWIVFSFFERFIAEKVCTACSRISHKIVPLTNLNKSLYIGKIEINVNINITNSNEPPPKKKNYDYRIVVRWLKKRVTCSSCPYIHKSESYNAKFPCNLDGTEGKKSEQLILQTTSENTRTKLC